MRREFFERDSSCPNHFARATSNADLSIYLLFLCLIIFSNAGAQDSWKPNILVIILDDSRYDSYAPNGGPSFFHSPAINRIATEGVNFKYCFPALSLCSPSRASIMTGLYPHHHGEIRNEKVSSFAFPTTAKILHDHGYYTGFTGKFGYSTISDTDGFDYWLESSTDDYRDSKYYFNNFHMHVITGHKTDVITQYALAFLDSVPQGKKFLLYVEHKAPHHPYEPRPQDSGIYANADIPFPANNYRWPTDYPSQYTECNHPDDTATLIANLEGYYELLAGAEASVDTILNALESRGILDSTLIIFSSDNGFLYGEHMLHGKELAFEESIRLPLFIRYPRWFTAGTVVRKEMAMNIDIAPTILEAAGIPDTFGMDGLSLHALANHSAHRKELFYEYFNFYCLPTFTAVRDFKYKYVHSRCTDTVEEFYDLVNDPEEDTNLINRPELSSLIQKYRNKTDSLKQVYGYQLVTDTILPCTMEDGSCSGLCNISAAKKVTDVTATGDCHDGKIHIDPSGFFNTFFHLALYDYNSLLIATADPISTSDAYNFENLASGTYSVKVFDKCCEFDLNNLTVKCALPTGLSASGISSNSATLSWTDVNCDDGYKIQYRKQGASAWITRNTIANVSNFTLSGLLPNAVYEWKVAAKCANTIPALTSRYSSIRTFTTSARLGESEWQLSPGILSIYPNPADEFITVEYDAIAESLQIINVIGEIVGELKIHDDDPVHKMEVSSLPPGIYTVVVRTNSGLTKRAFAKS